jgi:hypothetical protein
VEQSARSTEKAFRELETANTEFKNVLTLTPNLIQVKGKYFLYNTNNSEKDGPVTLREVTRKSNE